MRTLRSSLCLTLFLASCCGTVATAPQRPMPPPPPPPPAPGSPLQAWSGNHPAASQALGLWAHNHAPAAAWLFQWDGAHAYQSKELVGWLLARPGLGVPAFVETHPGWPEFNQFARGHQPALFTFFEWCRRFPAAAEALTNQPGGLEWAGHHLYAADRQLEQPGR